MAADFTFVGGKARIQRNKFPALPEMPPTPPTPLALAQLSRSDFIAAAPDLTRKNNFTDIVTSV
ncbi:hypothetical protein [Leclercia adecarboxylata]|uniref:hypothetical protein n=1 Tax=Leclercia adecarboxylata TaxID=83655 RepID=UPI001C3F3527|nr:hypothetical protein [Leclercia adecarboxylata]